MNTYLIELDIDSLELLFMNETKRFITALEINTPPNELDTIRSRVKDIIKALDEKKSEQVSII